MTAIATRRDDSVELPDESAGTPPVLELPDDLPAEHVEAALHVLAGVFTRRLLRRLPGTPPSNDNAR